MMLITSTWGDKKTFKLIPVTPDSPYNEGIYDPDTQVLALVGKERKQSLHMLPKLNDLGDVYRLKIGKRDNGKDYAEERKTLETYYEYYLENHAEIETFIKSVSINADSFDYSQYLSGAANPSTAETKTNLVTTV